MCEEIETEKELILASLNTTETISLFCGNVNKQWLTVMNERGHMLYYFIIHPKRIQSLFMVGVL